MRFIQPCFIRKNTPELCQRLRELGYYQNFLDNNSGEWLAVNHDMFISVNEGFQNLPFNDIDCGENEELFLALAALRDDISENQWFVMDVEVYSTISKSEWFLSTKPQGGKHVGTQIEPLYCHKATVEELIKHFKNND